MALTRRIDLIGSVDRTAHRVVTDEASHMPRPFRNSPSALPGVFSSQLRAAAFILSNETFGSSRQRRKFLPRTKETKQNEAIGEFLSLTIHVVGFLIIVAIIGFIWLILFVFIGPLAIVLIFLAGLGAAIAHSKGREFLEWLFWGTPGLSPQLRSADRRPSYI